MQLQENNCQKRRRSSNIERCWTSPGHSGRSCCFRWYKPAVRMSTLRMQLNLRNIVSILMPSLLDGMLHYHNTLVSPKDCKSLRLTWPGFFLCPIIGAVIDIYGHRISMIAFCGAGMLLCMGLLNWSSSMSGAAASYAVYAIVKNFGPVTIIDGIRTSMWEQNIFGSAYATKVTMNNA